MKKSIRPRRRTGRALDGLRPESRAWGFDRGTPVDRHYIEGWLARNADAVRGVVLEVGEDRYATRFGGGAVERVEVVDIDGANPAATIVGDLADRSTLAAEGFDCVICAQTLLLVFDVAAAIETIHTALRPGGTALVTVPGISRGCRPDEAPGGDYWRFTSASARRLLERRFGAERVAVEAFGNVFSAAAFLYGRAKEELRADELDFRDPEYEVIIAARARKDGG